MSGRFNLCRIVALCLMLSGGLFADALFSVQRPGENPQSVTALDADLSFTCTQSGNTTFRGASLHFQSGATGLIDHRGDLLLLEGELSYAPAPGDEPDSLRSIRFLRGHIPLTGRGRVWLNENGELRTLNTGEKAVLVKIDRSSVSLEVGHLLRLDGERLQIFKPSGDPAHVDISQPWPLAGRDLVPVSDNRRSTRLQRPELQRELDTDRVGVERRRARLSGLRYGRARY